MIKPLFSTAPPKKRGRPPGSRAKVVSTTRALGVHHFAFLRATLIGVELDKAFDRYLAWAETTTDLRHAEHRRAQLLAEVLAAGRRLDASREADRRITRQLDLLAEKEPAPAAKPLPTLEQWMLDEGMDPDAWSEAEAIEEYKIAHGLDAPGSGAGGEADGGEDALDPADPARARVAALNLLQALLATKPAGGDPIDLWFARPVVVKLRNVGIVTLENLAAYINVYGHRWHGRVKGFGAVRALGVVAWRRAQPEEVGLEIRASVDEPKTVHALRRGIEPGRIVLAPRFSLVPIEQLALPTELSGAPGLFRSNMPNTLEAANDLQAISAWLARFEERASTARSYRKEVERFVLWSTLIQRKAVSSATAIDCRAYRAFLQAIPGEWIEALPVPRSDPTWRPFRGQPSHASQKQSLVIVQAMFQGVAGRRLSGQCQPDARGHERVQSSALAD